MPGVVEGLLGREGERVERVGDVGRRVGVEREAGALLDDGAGERVGEIPRRQVDLDRRAAPFLAGLVLGDQRHLAPWRRPTDAR